MTESETPATSPQKDIHILEQENKTIILIGTAHVSRSSAELVSETIRSQTPDTVCVELCNTRLAAIRDADRWRNMDIVKVIREKKALMLFMNLLLSSFQKKVADKFGVKPGQEMLNAIEAAEEVGAGLVPADREIQTTLSRVWRGMGFWEKLKLIFSFVLSLGQSDDIEEADIEKMKQEDILQSLLSDVKAAHPIIERALIDERDQFLAEHIRTAPGEKTVAVVGAAHVPGIKRYIRERFPLTRRISTGFPLPAIPEKFLNGFFPGLSCCSLPQDLWQKGKPQEQT